MRPLRGQPYCFTHAPSNAGARRTARRKGGRHRAIGKAPAPADVASAQALERHLAQLLADTLLLPNSPRRTMTAVRVIEAVRRLREDTETRELLEQIRDELHRPLHKERRAP